ncbi:unnamed protein product [Parajaminaea phylloscopi]
MPVPTLQSAPGEGGFLLDSPLSAGESSRHPPPPPATNGHRDDDARPPCRLSPVQMTRLRSHLDALLLSIQRRFAKRFEPATHTDAALDTLVKYLAPWHSEVLPLIAKIDPVGAQQTSTAIAYAMNITDTICQGILGYTIATAPRKERRSPDSGQDVGARKAQDGPRFLYSAMTTLHLLDALWSALLVGRCLDLHIALKRAQERLKDRSSSHLRGVAAQRESTPLQGSLGTRTASVTDRVRLRNLLVTRRADLQQWLAQQAGVVMPQPPEEEFPERQSKATSEHSPQASNGKRRREREEGRIGVKRRRELFEEQGDIDAALPKDGIVERDESEDDKAKSEDSGEDDLEEVAVSVPKAPAPQPSVQNGDDKGEAAEEPTQNESEEHRHYRQLFDRKIDPDSESESSASEADEDEDADDAHDEAVAEKREVISKETVRDAEPSASARDKQNDEAAMALPSDPLQVEAIGSRLFARSLALLERLESLY